MKTEHFYINLTTDERNRVLESLVRQKSNLMAQGKYTDAVDDVILKISKAKRKKFRIRYI
ncbi:MAG: hypothetical protein EOM34_09885 [Clostridia bacterium]|nr:hypothetical protein [Clostridia bacterium]